MSHQRMTLMAFAVTLGVTAVALAIEPRASLPPAPPPSPELSVSRPHATASSAMHPRVVLRDAEGRAVIDSSAPVDARTTCAPCHDVTWIASHGFHFANAGAPPSLIMSGAPGSPTPNCFFCHVRRANVNLARAVLDSGNSQWVAAATLHGTGVVVSAEALPDAKGPVRFEYVRSSFGNDGSVSADQLHLGPPGNEACGACHGLVTRTSPKLTDFLARPTLTEYTGQVFSPDRINNSTLNLKDRETTARSWDVHAERLLGCSDCHYAPNDPRAQSLIKDIPRTLRLEPRHAGLGAFLRRPNHDFARGSRQVSCESCHNAKPLHEFLPHTERHLARVNCEVCHVPKNLVPVLREVDASLPLAPGQPRLAYRGLEGSFADATSYITGSQPVIVARRDATGQSKLTPVNFVITWNWRQGSARGASVEEALVKRVLFDNDGKFRREVVTALDSNHDGQLQEDERVFDTDARVQAVARLLTQAGVSSPVRVGEVRPIAIRHGITSGRYAVRDCTSCHSQHSRLKAETVLAEAVAPGSLLVYAGDPSEVTLSVEPKASSAKALARVDDRQLPHYVFGSSRSRWVDSAGLGLASLVFLGAFAHGALRVRASYRRRRSR
jgi:hypothetical protein